MGPAKSPTNHQPFSPTHQKCQRSSQTLDAFENEAKNFLRAYPTLLALSRDARTANRSHLLQLLKEGAVYEIRPLAVAVEEYYAVIGKKRIKINENLIDDEGLEALHWAGENDHLATVVLEYLVALETAQYLVGAKTHRVHPCDGKTGRNILHWASLTGDLDLVKMLMNQARYDLIDTFDRNGSTPLHLASLSGKLKVVKFLILECGARVEAEDEDGSTALHFASENGHHKVVRFLVMECGADVEAKDRYGQTPLHLASWYGQYEIVRFLVLECGANVQAEDEDRETPLHSASKNGHLEIVKFLMECGADDC